VRLAAAVVAVVLAVTGCTPTASAPSPTAASTGPTEVAGLASFYAQKVTWMPCGTSQGCATASVPLDYADPAGATIKLALRRTPASAVPRLGTLFVNPGGPGVSPASLGDWFNRDGLEAYDLVEWDPRGVGASSPVVCSDAATARLVDVDASPDTPAEASALAAAMKEFGDACAAGSGRALLQHVSTVESARDLDILRSLVGDERLTFYGASYGTLLGARYADLFPDRVGRLVLDSPVDVTDQDTTPQTAGFEADLHAFAAWCAAASGCGWGSDETAVVAALSSWLRALDAAPLAVGDRVLTQSQAAVAVEAGFYGGRRGWPTLSAGLAAARGGDGSAMLAVADAASGRRFDGTWTGLLPAATAIRCADGPRRTASEVDAAWARDRAEAPVFGYLQGPDLVCSDWPVPAASWVTPRASGAPPILVVGATGDPATPYAWAKTTAATLASARLLTYDGYGHVSYGGSTCVDAAVRAYLVVGTLPPAGTVCR
jgi:pimeloyl-ACP methyl ester carboxylesterase